MAVSKLFTPKVHPNETSVDDRREKADMFVNPPTHAAFPRFQGPTDKGDPCHPLKLGGNRQSDTSKVQQRGFVTRNRIIDY